MRGRLGGRIGLPLGPLVGRATGMFHIADVMQAKKYIGWPIVRADPAVRAFTAGVITSSDYGASWPSSNQVKARKGVVSL